MSSEEINYPPLTDLNQYINPKTQLIEPPILEAPPQHVFHNYPPPQLPIYPPADRLAPIEGVEKKEEKKEPLIYTVGYTDTLDGIAIKHGVSKVAIQMANGFVGEEIYMFKTLRIPFSVGQLYYMQHPIDEAELKRRDSLELLNKILIEMVRKYPHIKQNNFDKEAKFYMEMHEYNFEAALTQAEGDFKFEREQEELMKKRNKYKKN